MSFQAVPNTASFVVRYVENTTALFFGSNQLHFEAITPPITDATLTTAVETLGEAWNDNIMPLVSNALVFANVIGTDLSTSMAVQATYPSATIGSVASPRQPGNVTIAIKFLTGATGRSRRGRLFWMGLTEGQVAGNTVDGNLVADIVEAFGAVQDAMLAIGWQFVVVSRVQDGVTLTNGIPYPVTSVTVTDLRVDTMRGRLRF